MEILLLFATALVFVACSASAAVLPLDTPEMAIKVEAGEYIVRGRTVRVACAAQLPIAPPDRIEVRREEVVITDEPPQAYSGGTVLAKTLGPVDRFTRYPNAIDPASVRVYSPEPGGAAYAEAKDYTLDHTWGGLARVESGGIPKGARVCVDYDVFLQRVDLVQVSPAGAAHIKRGLSAMACPEMPAPDPGFTALAYAYVPHRAGAITGESVYPIPATGITWRDFAEVSGRGNLRHTLGLLKSRQPVTVVCWGDSVTAGGSSSSPDKCYVELFRSRLKAAYPGTPITLINAGIGGSNTDSRRAGFEKEVLAHKPDLITVEFINDVGMGPDRIKSNWAEFVSRARSANPKVEFIFLTPHFMMPEWMGSFGKSVAAMRNAAEENKAALGDAAKVWANLRAVGIPYETLLANGINHPNDLGHEFFAECLMRLAGP
jgi:lysophospholipase L1-like esterase